MIQISSIPALIQSSLLLCIFGIIMTSVLLREQRGLLNTDVATAVSIVISFYIVSVANLDV